MQDISPIANMEKHLIYLSLHGCRNLTSIESLSNCKRLREVNLTELVKLEDISPISVCKDIEVLNLSDCKSILSIQPLQSLAKLKDLDLSFACEKFEDVDFCPLGKIGNLEKLNLKRTCISDLKILTSCRKLRELNLSECRQACDLNPLRVIPLTKLIRPEPADHPQPF